MLYLLVQRLCGGSGKVSDTESLAITNEVYWNQIYRRKTHSCGVFFPIGAALDKMWVSLEKGIISNEFWKCHTGYWLIGLAVSMIGASVDLSLWSNFESSRAPSLPGKYHQQVIGQRWAERYGCVCSKSLAEKWQEWMTLYHGQFV